MKITKTLYKIKGKYSKFTEHPLTKHNPVLALAKYVCLNFRLHILKQEVLITYLNGIKCLVKKGDGISGNYFFKLYEYQDSLFLLHFLKEGDVFIDIGANVGHFSLLAASKSNVNIISIEPVPNTFTRLKSNININNYKSIKTHNIGLSNTSGELYFTTGLYTTNRVTDKSNINSVAVSVSTLDKVVDESKVNVIKIDVEGYEKFVLEGGEQTLKLDSLQAIIIELNESGALFDVADSEIVNLLESNGFKAYSYNPFSRTFDVLKTKNETEFNTIFIKDLNKVKDRVQHAKAIKIGRLDI